MSEREPVGTLAEEAAKLLAAFHVWTGDAGTAKGEPLDEPAESDAGDAADECRWCLLCQLTRRARATSPEVRDHLLQAAASLALAVKGLLDDPAPTPRRETPLEKIDLTEE
jgi:hypothetical protein